MTQLEKAANNEITKEMKYVAEQEEIDANLLRKRVAEGLAVIPANINHKHLKPVGIGYGLKTKVNANIGTSPIKSNLETELEKLSAAISAGADTVMDLSLGGNVDEIRKRLMEKSAVPVGTVPIYQAVIEAGGPENLTLDKYLEVFEKHARDGVDFATVHAGVTKEAISLLEKRVMPTVSRGGTFLVNWMRKHNKQSFLYEGFDEILKIAKKYDVTISLGDGLRPGCIEDATDEAQLHELKVLGELAARCREKQVQVMIEGPGHIPLNEIEKNVRLEKEICKNAPFYVLGPLPTDIAAGYDHVTCAIGGALAGMHGADFLCYVTPKEHISLPDVSDVRDGVIVMRIAAHIADIAKGRQSSKQRDKLMSEARSRLDWEAMADYSLDPVNFRKLLKEECKSNPEISEGCSMCGKYCTEKK
ncbi:MAG: phosphomethylpyrimidine synthase ThiC [Candidatus Diapherotrites archaeon]|nr:phosphomethylpyrimidine synthase ThiC [Candidatus Diapherotrites archaeon]